ncbi:M3 family oligoendopeptidase [Kosmotoga pacifica]|uniref:Peptidase M3 n=1 Tax=Kosmotoga pacifica TaxID=1330330 RepID=A0A0G2Z5G3_9BACT|nr:M3 family oligoendopeptidase [Kosmotoga pacifica]AKI96807.1 peptidase M3 [Kosmotoga pacifica]
MKTGAEKIRWNLSELYDNPQSPNIEKDIATIKGEINRIAKELDEILRNDPSPLRLKKAFEALEEAYEKNGKILMYAFLLFSEDTSNPQANKLMLKAQELFSEFENKLVAFRLKLAKLADNEFENLFGSELLSNYRHFAEKERKRKEFMLSEKEEQIINLKNLTGNQALAKLYTEFVSSQKYEIEIDGEKKILNESEVRALRMHENSELREKAFKALFTRLKEHETVFTNIYNAIAKDWVIEAKKRGFPNPISVRNLDNEISDEIITSLIETTTRNNDIVHRYYKLKAKIMRAKRLKHSDIYAPIGSLKKTYSWSEAREMVLDALSKFDSKVVTIVKEFFDASYIHAPVMRNKRGGAFCYYVGPNVHPYVLLNFTGQLEDVMTLAHELGHGLHGVLSQKQTLLNYHTPLTLAETASVFSEMLMMDYLLDKIEDWDEKISFIASKLESMFATMHRQNMFTRFEVMAHEAISEQYMTFDELSAIYRQELESMFGDSIEYFDFSGYEWAGIPHMFHTPFYCYAYNFAQLLVISLYEKYLEDGNRFIPKYLELLSSGGSDSPEKLLARVGVNLKDPSFWQRGFDFLVKRLLEPLEELIQQRV